MYMVTYILMVYLLVVCCQTKVGYLSLVYLNQVHRDNQIIIIVHIITIIHTNVSL